MGHYFAGGNERGLRMEATNPLLARVWSSWERGGGLEDRFIIAAYIPPELQVGVGVGLVAPWVHKQ